MRVNRNHTFGTTRIRINDQNKIKKNRFELEERNGHQLSVHHRRKKNEKSCNNRIANDEIRLNIWRNILIDKIHIHSIMGGMGLRLFH